ncbi:cupredoxin domain-containing protein [Ramlibacter sp. MAHUQ-53]|uniref:cupredoxin domain-containing protein n=1 Tax=unclassified Ramlibacter TaxID=2617605 RepID=UPI003634C0C0
MTRFLSCTLAALFALAPMLPARAHGDAAHGGAPRAFDPARVEATPFGQEGDPKKVTRTVQVRMGDDMRFVPGTLTVRRGETVRLRVANRGQVMHELVIGTPRELAEHAEQMRKFPGMEHDAPHMAHVKPGATGEIVWQFTQAGEFQFACLIPGHFEAGMVGKVVVR